MKFLEKLRTFEYRNIVYSSNDHPEPDPPADIVTPKQRPCNQISEGDGVELSIPKFKISTRGRYCKFHFNWIINDLLNKLESGENHYSPTFTTGYREKEFRWKLCLRKGANPGQLRNTDCCNISLEFKGPTIASASARVIFYFISNSGETVLKTQLEQQKFSSTDYRDGVEYYLSLGTTQQLICRENFGNFHVLLYINEADFHEKASVGLSLENLEENNRVESNSYLLNNAASSINNLLKRVISGENVYSDLRILSADGVSFHCHKAILSDNEVFSANLTMDTEDSRQNCIKLDDIHSDVLKELLKWLYTGNVESLHDVAEGLLYAAEKYMLEKLKELCEDELMHQLTIDNATALLLLADSVGAERLKERCISVVISERQGVVRSSGWSKILTRPDLINEILLGVEERAMFLGICGEWDRHW